MTTIVKLDMLMYILNSNYKQELHKNRKMMEISMLGYCVIFLA